MAMARMTIATLFNLFGTIAFAISVSIHGF